MKCDEILAQIISQASFTAIPFRSLPELAAVAEVFWYFCGISGGYLHFFYWYSENTCSYLSDFLEKALTHFGATMINSHRAVIINVN